MLETSRQAAEMFVEFAAVDGQIAATLTKVTVNGEEFDLALFAGANESFAAAINGEIDYYVDSISITDDEMTVTGHRE